MKAVPLYKSLRLNLRPLKLELNKISRAPVVFLKNRPVAVLLLALLLVAGTIHQIARHTVTVYVDGEPFRTIRTFSRTVEEVLTELSLEPHPRDRVAPAQSSLLSRQTRIDLDRAFPVFVLADNTVREIWTPVMDAGQLLAEEGYSLGPYDRIEPAGLGNLYAMAELKIIRVEKLYETRQSEIPYAEVTRGNPDLDRGLSRVVSAGKKGLQEELVQVTFEDGLAVDRSIVQATVLEKPVDRIVENGENTRLERDGRVLQFDRAMYVTATSYCPGTPGSGCPLNDQGHAFCTGPYNNGYTYTGKRTVQGRGTFASPRMVAVDPRMIPLGTMLYIEEIPGIGKIGFAVAEDIGGAIKGNRIDILYDKHSDVARFGLRRGIKVYVLTAY